MILYPYTQCFVYHYRLFYLSYSERNPELQSSFLPENGLQCWNTWSGKRHDRYLDDAYYRQQLRGKEGGNEFTSSGKQQAGNRLWQKVKHLFWGFYSYIACLPSNYNGKEDWLWHNGNSKAEVQLKGSLRFAESCLNIIWIKSRVILKRRTSKK